MPKPRERASSAAIERFAEAAESTVYTANPAADGYTVSERPLATDPRLKPNAARGRATRFAMNDFEHQLLAYASEQEGISAQLILRQGIWKQLRERYPEFTPDPLKLDN